MALPQIAGAFGLGGKGSALAELTSLFTGKRQQDDNQKKTGYFEVVSVLNKILAVLETKLTDIARGGIGSGSDSLGADALKKLGGASPGGALGSSAMSLLGGSAKADAVAPGALGADAMAKLAGAAGGAAKAVVPVAEGLGAVATKCNPVVAGLTAVWNGLGNLVGVFGEIKNAATSLGNAVAPFVRLANPGLVQRFTLASDDLTASIGRALMPVMEHATLIVRRVADAFMALSGTLSNAFGNGLKAIDKILESVFAEITPLINIFGKLLSMITAIVAPINSLVATIAKIVAFHFEVVFHALEIVLTPLMAVVEAFGLILEDLMDVIGDAVDSAMKYIRDLLGIKSIAGGSVGAAVRPAQFQSIEDYGKKAQQAAFSLGTASSPAERTAGFAKQIYEELQKILRELGAILGAIPKTPSEAVERIADRGRDAGREIAGDTVADLAEDAWDVLSLRGLRR